MKYPGFLIDAAYKVVSNNKVSYETVITKGESRDILVFDEKGTFLNKYPADKTILNKVNADVTQPDLNKKINSTTEQPNAKLKNDKKGKEEEEEPIQKNKPDKKPIKN
jgi:hypothetical protein